MRLLNTTTLRLETFAVKPPEPYAILSHTWGENEVLFDDINRLLNGDDAQNAPTAAWSKVWKSCEIAASMGLTYIWIDTCCIDKTSSAELSEAINSMFRWYEEAQVCLAFLSDVPSIADGENGEDSDNHYVNAHSADGEELDDKDGHSATSTVDRYDKFRRSRWFVRGWTLQELIAPHNVTFYSDDWQEIGTRHFLTHVINEITGVPDSVLLSRFGERRACLDDICVAERMRWASNRSTTRPEDVAYCLLGLFDINMPLLYGEGEAKAFKRLQEEIIKSTDDDTIYAWACDSKKSEEKLWSGLLADSPAFFARKDSLVIGRSPHLTRTYSQATTATNRGLQLELHMIPFSFDQSGSLFVALLDCLAIRDRRPLVPAVLLQRTSWHSKVEFVRIKPHFLLGMLGNEIRFPDALVNWCKEKVAPTIICTEAVPRHIFIPHALRAPRSISGLIFHPILQTSRPIHKDKPIIVQVLSKSEGWFIMKKLHGSKFRNIDSYMFNYAKYPPPEVADLTDPVTLGWMELALTDGWNKWQVRLVCGLERVPYRGLTKGLYAEPWYSFDAPDGEQEQRRHSKCIGSRKLKYPLEKGIMRVSFDVETQSMCLFCSIKLVIDDKLK